MKSNQAVAFLAMFQAQGEYSCYLQGIRAARLLRRHPYVLQIQAKNGSLFPGLVFLHGGNDKSSRAQVRTS